jgi:hypothetical protein
MRASAEDARSSHGTAAACAVASDAEVQDGQRGPSVQVSVTLARATTVAALMLASEVLVTPGFDEKASHTGTVTLDAVAVSERL